MKGKLTMLIDKKAAAEILSSHDDYLILSHANPDGDTLGCAYGLCGILQKLGKRAKCLCADEIVPRMEYLRQSVDIQQFEHKNVVTVDVADKLLLGQLCDAYADDVLLSIDHHECRAQFAKNSCVYPDAAAACEIIFDIAQLLGAELDGRIAACLYTGIATDTGCFKFSNVTSRTHEIAGRLMQYDFDYSGINYLLFDMKTKGRIALERDLIDGMRFYADDRIAVVCLTEELMEKYSGKIDVEDLNGLASLPRQVDGVILGITVKFKKKGVYKVSMRSAEPINAAELCALFGGGGHARAAGCTLKGTLDEVNERLMSVITGKIELS